MQQLKTATGVTGRDDPSNIIGYQKLNEPGTAGKIVRMSQERSKRVLDPLKDRKTMVVLANGPEDTMATALQRKIQGMLTDLNRAKTMRIANQVIKEQHQTQMQAVQSNGDDLL